MDHQHRLDRVLAILAQPALELCWISGRSPIIGQGLDPEPKGLAPHTPVEREKAALDDEQLVTGREQVDQRGLPRTVTRCGVGEDRLIGFEHPLQAGKALLGDGTELRAVEVDRPAIHRPQYAVRNVGRPGIDKKMRSATDCHKFSPNVALLYPLGVRAASAPFRRVTPNIIG